MHTDRRWLTFIQTCLSLNQSSSLNKVRINIQCLICLCLRLCVWWWPKIFDSDIFSPKLSSGCSSQVIISVFGRTMGQLKHNYGLLLTQSLAVYKLSFYEEELWVDTWFSFLVLTTKSAHFVCLSYLKHLTQIIRSLSVTDKRDIQNMQSSESPQRELRSTGVDFSFFKNSAFVLSRWNINVHVNVKVIRVWNSIRVSK